MFFSVERPFAPLWAGAGAAKRTICFPGPVFPSADLDAAQISDVERDPDSRFRNRGDGKFHGAWFKVVPAKVFPRKVFPRKVFPAKIFPTKVFPTKVFPSPHSA